MAKNRKEKIIDDVEEYLEDIPEGIIIPPKVVEALLVANAMSNKTATNDVCNQIREICIAQGYEKF